MSLVGLLVVPQPLVRWFLRQIIGFCSAAVLFRPTQLELTSSALRFYAEDDCCGLRSVLIRCLSLGHKTPMMNNVGRDGVVLNMLLSRFQGSVVLPLPLVSVEQSARFVDSAETKIGPLGLRR